MREHKKACLDSDYGSDCCVSMFHLRRLAEAGGIEFTDEELRETL
jgi:hypothetical protein